MHGETQRSNAGQELQAGTGARGISECSTPSNGNKGRGDPKGQRVRVCSRDCTGHMQGPGCRRPSLASQGHRDSDAILYKGQCPSHISRLQGKEGLGMGGSRFSPLSQGWPSHVPQIRRHRNWDVVVSHPS